MGNRTGYAGYMECRRDRERAQARRRDTWIFALALAAIVGGSAYVATWSGPPSARTAVTRG